MKKVEILSIGTELLAGQIANTDAQYISRKLPEIGLSAYYHTVVGDNHDRAADCLKNALKRADIVITTGGLGPTQDDITKNVVADTLGLKLTMHEESRKRIEHHFICKQAYMPESNYNQALIPEGAVVLQNDCGTAPGLAIKTIFEGAEKTIVILPGPPRELSAMFDSYALPYLASESNIFLKSKFIKIAQVGESTVEEKMIDMISGQTNPTFATYCKEGVVTVRVSANADSLSNADRLLSEAVDKIRKIFGDAVFSEDDEEPEEVLVRLLKEKSLKITCAESCTGGMIATKLTSVSGASNVFEEGFITYSNNGKHNMIGVDCETIAKFGAVSKETALKMAIGAAKAACADVSISITGNAGPSALEGKPVGLVYIGIKAREIEEVCELHLNGTRERIRTLASVYAIDNARRLVQKLR